MTFDRPRIEFSVEVSKQLAQLSTADREVLNAGLEALAGELSAEQSSPGVQGRRIGAWQVEYQLSRSRGVLSVLGLTRIETTA